MISFSLRVSFSSSKWLIRSLPIQQKYVSQNLLNPHGDNCIADEIGIGLTYFPPHLEQMLFLIFCYKDDFPVNKWPKALDPVTAKKNSVEPSKKTS